LSRSVRAGEIISLRARFTDDLDQNVQADNVYLHLFEPDVDTTDLSLAYLVSGEPSYLGQGIFQYDFLTPTAGPGGIWHDVWEGDLTLQDISNTLNFEIVNSGVILYATNQLYVNNLVEVTVYSGITATDGTVLADDYTFTFQTTLSPNYSNIKKLRLEVGGYIQDLYDDTIDLALAEASIEADLMTWALVKNGPLYEHARREWVTCRAGSLLLTNLSNSVIKSKSLDNFRVDYDTQGLFHSLDRLIACYGKWHAQLQAGGYEMVGKKPSMVIKGYLDGDKPAIGRLWTDPESIRDVQHLPAQNQKFRPLFSRRYTAAFTKFRKPW
jgi:hypothetical protein